MDFMTEIESRVCRYREEADHLRTRLAHLDELIAHGTAIIDGRVATIPTSLGYGNSCGKPAKYSCPST